MLEIAKGVGLGDKPEDESVDKKELHDESKTAGEDQIRDIFERAPEVILTPDGGSNQRKHRERRHHNDPVDDLEQTRVQFLEDRQKIAPLFAALLQHDCAEGNAKDQCHDTDCGKVSIREGKDCIVGDELHEYSFIHRIAQRDLGRNCARRSHEAHAQIFNDKVLIFFRRGSRRAGDASVWKFGQELGCVGAAERDHRRFLAEGRWLLRRVGQR